MNIKSTIKDIATVEHVVAVRQGVRIKLAPANCKNKLMGCRGEIYPRTDCWFGEQGMGQPLASVPPMVQEPCLWVNNPVLRSKLYC